MINTPQGYWHLGTANSIEYATELAEKHMETNKDGGVVLIKKEINKGIMYEIYAKEKK